MSISGNGQVAEGIEAIRQCIDLIVRTTKGTDPLRPEFGSDVYKYQDLPVNLSIPRIKKALLDAISLWEPRVKISSIAGSLVGTSNLQFILTYTLVDDALTDSLTFLINNGGIYAGTGKQRLILRGYFPPNPNSFQYQISLLLDGGQILPASPETGFSTIQEMYTWVQTNWLNYAQWYLTANSIVGFINGGYSQGSLSVSLLAQTRYESLIPVAPIGFKYSLTVVLGVRIYTNTSDIFTPGQLLNYVQNDPVLSALGFWQVLTNDGSFNDDFMDDFDLYTQFLQVITGQAGVVVITIAVISQ